MPIAAKIATKAPIVPKGTSGITNCGIGFLGDACTSKSNSHGFPPTAATTSAMGIAAKYSIFRARAST